MWWEGGLQAPRPRGEGGEGLAAPRARAAAVTAFFSAPAAAPPPWAALGGVGPFPSERVVKGGERGKVGMGWER